MQDLVGNQGTVNAYGPKVTICLARFAGASATAMVLADNFGIKSVVQTGVGTGIFDVTLAEKFPGFSARVWVTGDTTLIHDCVVTAENTSAGTFRFTHYVGTATRATVPSSVSNGLSPLVTFHIQVLGRGAM